MWSCGCLYFRAKYSGGSLRPCGRWFMVLWLITRQLWCRFWSPALHCGAGVLWLGFPGGWTQPWPKDISNGAMLGAVLYLFGLLVPAIRFPFTRLSAWAAPGPFGRDRHLGENRKRRPGLAECREPAISARGAG